MALQKNIVLQNELLVSNAYIRIDTVSGYKGGLDISINTYTSKPTFENGFGYLEQVIHHFFPSVDDDSPNFIKQGYEYLKTLPEYAEAIDC